MKTKEVSRSAAPSRKYNCLDLLYLFKIIFMPLYKTEKIKSAERGEVNVWVQG